MSTDDTAGAVPGKAEIAVEVIDDLTTEWVALQRQGKFNLHPRRKKSVGQAASTLGMAQHVHATVGILRPALPDGLTIAHMPLVRSVFETALRTVWLDSHPEAVSGLVKEQERQMKNLGRTMEKDPSLREVARERPELFDVSSEATSLDAEARSLERMLGDGGTHLYFIYRTLCTYTHPTAYLATRYLELNEKWEWKINASARDQMADQHTWLVACSYVWTTRVLTYYNRDDDLRRKVREHARRLNTRSEFRSY